MLLDGGQIPPPPPPPCPWSMRRIFYYKVTLSRWPSDAAWIFHNNLFQDGSSFFGWPSVLGKTSLYAILFTLNLFKKFVVCWWLKPILVFSCTMGGRTAQPGVEPGPRVLSQPIYKNRRVKKVRNSEGIRRVFTRKQEIWRVFMTFEYQIKTTKGQMLRICVLQRGKSVDIG